MFLEKMFQSSLVDLQWNFFFFFKVPKHKQKKWEHWEQVSPAGHMLTDGAQPSPEVYRHRYAGLDHFWKCLQLHRDWRRGQFKRCTAASRSAPGGVTGSGCCKIPHEKYGPTSAAAESMHRTARTGNLVWHWWNLQQKPPQMTFPLDGKRH